jgi:hypothetical protein
MRGAAWKNGTRLVAKPFPDVFRAAPDGSKWTNENHSLTTTDFMTIIDEWTLVHQELIAGESRRPRRSGAGSSRTCLSLPRTYVNKLKAIGGGISLVGGWRYISGTAIPSGPPFRMILDSGIRSGLSSDGMQISPMNPWPGHCTKPHPTTPAQECSSGRRGHLNAGPESPSHASLSQALTDSTRPADNCRSVQSRERQPPPPPPSPPHANNRGTHRRTRHMKADRS